MFQSLFKQRRFGEILSLNSRKMIYITSPDMTDPDVRMLTGMKKREHIAPVLASLHEIPVHYRIQYKMALVVFKALNGHAPASVVDMLCMYASSRSLRSASQSLLPVPRSRLKQKGARSEERRVGKECASTCRSRVSGWPVN